MIKILYVDDDKVTLDLVKEILEGARYDVITLPDPRDALDHLEREEFDLVISDANMPGGMSGFDLVKTIRANSKLAGLPVALLTGRRDKKDIQHGLECGADDYIIKPIDPLILLGKVEALLKKRPPKAPSMKFPEGPVRQRAVWNVDLEITYISERGLLLSCPFFVAAGTKIKLESDFFNQIEIEPPTMRVVGYTRDPSNASMFLINVNFIGLNDGELQKIRLWLNTKLTYLSRPKTG